ncbi:MAG TPA: EF-hand domain-containing protein [Rhodanobacteraceae bacterium]|nr:EF-hand domain-containing protein [Rhodanobacteraceae bacterium]
MFRRCTLLIALSLPAAAINAQTAPAQKPSPPVKMQAAPTKPGAQEEPRKSPFDEMDTNHDGFVSRDEFIAYQKKRFDEFDTNHDGKIDAKEIASSPPLMERNLKTAERMIRQWDKNGDGIVTADEFKQDSVDRFARQDKSGSGKIARPAPPQMPAKGQLMPNGQPKPPAQLQPQPQPQPTKP